MSDEGMSDAKLHKLVSCDHDKGCGMRYAACSCGYEKVLESALPLLLARATAAERERDALAKELGTTKRAFARSIGENPDVMAALQAGITEGLATGRAERDALREALSAMLLMYDAGGVTLGAAKDARAALTANHSAPVVEG